MTKEGQPLVIEIPKIVNDNLLTLEASKIPLREAIARIEQEQASILGTITVMSGAGPFVPHEWDTSVGGKITRIGGGLAAVPEPTPMRDPMAADDVAAG